MDKILTLPGQCCRSHHTKIEFSGMQGISSSGMVTKAQVEVACIRSVIGIKACALAIAGCEHQLSETYDHILVYRIGIRICWRRMDKFQQVVEFFYPWVFLTIGVLKAFQVRRNRRKANAVGVIQIRIGEQVVFQEKVERRPPLSARACFENDP